MMSCAGGPTGIMTIDGECDCKLEIFENILFSESE
jgi:hypothetical protein